MSHTTSIEDVQITDVHALKQTIADLQKQGVDCKLEENATPRAYYNNQLQQAPFVLRLNKSRFDVGFYDNGNGGYVPKCDIFADEILGQIGVRKDGVPRERQAIGRFMQAYATNAAQRAAVKQGFKVQRAMQQGVVTLPRTR
jgi:hypothetical protein